MDKIKFIFSGVFEFLKPFIKILLTQSGVILMKATQETVQAIATNMQDKEGHEKREVAFNLISNRLQESGIELASVVINSAIEAAVLKLKEK